VDAGREEEGDQRGGILVDLHGGDGAVVDVTEEEVVDGTVPVSGELVPGHCMHQNTNVSSFILVVLKLALHELIPSCSLYLPLFHHAS
jgi:hypothetical protein